MTNPLPVEYLLDEYKDTSDQEIHHLYTEVVDRWTWDTGSDEDKKLMWKLGREHDWRGASRMMHAKEANSLEEAMAREITNEIDRQILRDLIKISDEMNP
jgi:hypothetical protein